MCGEMLKLTVTGKPNSMQILESDNTRRCVTKLSGIILDVWYNELQISKVNIYVIASKHLTQFRIFTILTFRLETRSFLPLFHVSNNERKTKIAREKREY